MTRPPGAPLSGVRSGRIPPVLDERELATYANGVAAALRVIGPTPRADVLAMMRALHLTEVEVVEVVAYALDHGILDADEDMLRASAPA